ncbi:hypothetical protein YWIDRAFT_06518 [Streptomyces sp. SceaMP-e96]|nr:hypothetical protein YWIDRAFT_06518 [Streptomyces sp. SceaMP-e96]
MAASGHGKTDGPRGAIVQARSRGARRYESGIFHIDAPFADIPRTNLLRRALQRSGERRRDRYLPATEPQLPVQATRMTKEEALAELAGTSREAPAAPRRREEPYQPLPPIPVGWVRPGQATGPLNPSSEDA